MQRKSACKRELVMRPQVESTSAGFKVNDPCLAMQVAKGSGSLDKLLEKMDAFFSAR